MSFAAEFERIFNEIFGAGRLKPRIRAAGHGLWSCAFGNGLKGYGQTPRDAYVAWQNLLGGTPGAYVPRWPPEPTRPTPPMPAVMPPRKP